MHTFQGFGAPQWAQSSRGWVVMFVMVFGNDVLVWGEFGSWWRWCECDDGAYVRCFGRLIYVIDDCRYVHD
jgi:hypothetical protein